MFICMYIITVILLVSSLFILSLPEIYIVGAIVLFVFLPFTFRKRTHSEDAYLFVTVHPVRVVPAMIKESNKNWRKM
ncbi:hypothetical protein JBW_03705 [Pelosinus fermentans JBW45]|uniref:Uncharacterized protein n=1 Tax=Pelosinus fermentans JBW45 TaxID=1192197 RepID=I8TSW4_9FIRM|nr:hypothetical protein JBW_03705 [Pelosinus fermentans JBW45]